MGYNLITNIESCYTDIPNLLYYSHIPPALIVLLFGIFVLWKSKENRLAGKILFVISILFFTWVSVEGMIWLLYSSINMMFLWSFLGALYVLMLIFSLYFVYVVIDKKDISLNKKYILAILFLPIVLMTPTAYNLTGFDIVNCQSLESNYFISYRYFLGVVFIIWILTSLYLRYKKVQKESKKQILFLGFGILSFLFLFSYSEIAGSLTQNFEVTQYGLFGMPVFIGFLAYLIVRYKAFNIKLIGTQALVVAQFILIGSMFFFAQSLTNQILVGVTLIGTTIMGGYVIRSVKAEIARKEELQKISDALAIANQRLKELDLTKSEFISIASHQLRTPLTAIKGYISLILEGSYGKVPAVIQDVLDKVYTVNSRLVHLVEDLLNVSRIEAGCIQYSFVQAQLEPLVAELVEMFTPTARSKNLLLQMRLPKKPLPPLTIDPNKIKEVLSNLIDNALKYTKEGGVTVTLEGDKKRARISVTDTGIGIRAEDKENLFEKFTRSKETTKMVASGAGLGLYVGKNFVEAHGGRIWAESPVPSEGGQAPMEGDGADKGSRFIIELPLVNPKIHIGISDQPSPSEKT